MSDKVLNIGIMPKIDYHKRTIAIAKGEYTPKANEPKVWFESLQSMAQILNSENQKLLKLIIDKQPQSLKELETLSGITSSNLSRTLKTMERYKIPGLCSQSCVRKMKRRKTCSTMPRTARKAGT